MLNACFRWLRKFATSFALVLLMVPSVTCAEPVFEAVDDTGSLVRLPARPERIVSLSPHLTEMLFSLGAGDRIVATVQHSDYPAAARAIPRLGDAFSLSIEAVVAISPDLIVSWMTGGNQRTLGRLRELGYPVYQNEAATLDDIASNMERLGRLIGAGASGQQAALAFRTGLRLLQEKHAKGAAEAVRVFFQIADEQLYTVNDRHLIGQALTVCGAQNIFGDLEIMVPMVSFESIVEAEPDAILVASPHEQFESRWLTEWQALGWGQKVRYINASLITRPGPRMLEGVKSLCNLL